MICLTFDVEERFHSHLTPEDAPRRWDAGARIERIVELLASGGHRATFFVVGELAEHYPDVVRRMVECGFEVASHSHTHLWMDAANRDRCMADIARSKSVIENLTGRPVSGFRAPSWSARRSDDWLWDHLARLGFRYDSSLFPFRTHRYGSWSNPLQPFRHPSGLIEVPPSVAKLGPLRLPYGGGFYFRIYPAWLTRMLIDRDLRKRKTPVVYFHPWEFERDTTRMETGLLNRFIANYNSGNTWGGFTDLLTRYRTAAMVDVLETLSIA